MDAAAFWKVIGEYNLNTGRYQIALLALLSNSTHLQRIRRCHTSSCRYIWRSAFMPTDRKDGLSS